MTNDLRAAAERLRRTIENEDERPYRNDGNGFKRNCDEGLLIAAYLAEHPADDDEAVDTAWLESIGGRKGWHPNKITFDRDDALAIGLWNVDDGWKAMLIHHENAASCIVRGLKARGAVRRLLSAITASRDAQ